MKLNRKSNILSLSTLVLSGALAIACGGGSDGSTSGGSGDGDGDMVGEGDGDEGETGDGDMTSDGDMSSIGDGDGDTAEMGGAPGDEPLEAAAPRVLSTSIEDGDVGVLPDATIVIEFTEAMDRKSVEDAYSSETLSSEDAEFTWNDDWTVLTISPLDPLKFEVAEAADELDPAVQYDFLIDKTALSAGGENLGMSLGVSFSTARQVSEIVPATGVFTGSVRSDGNEYPTIYSGDSKFEDLAGKAGYYGTLSFDLTDIEDVIGVGGGQIVFSRFIHGESDPEDLGAPSLYSVQADAHEWDAVHPQILEENQVGPVELHSGDEYYVNVDDALMSELEGDGVAQFAFAQPEKTNDDEIADTYRYENPILAFTYWVN